MRRVIVDTDTGIDDALALLYLAADPQAEIAGVTAVYGNCVVEDSLRNIAAVLQLAGLSHVPVARGAAGPLVGDAHIAHYVHGHDGLGDVLDDRPAVPANLQRASAAEYLVQVATEAPGELDLIALGPLTNLALALEIDPDLFLKYRSVAIMGGSGPFPPLGTVHMIDANVQNDGAAAAAVFAAPARSRLMVGVDVTATVITDERDQVALERAGTPTAAFAARILDAYHDFYRYAWGRRVAPAHDALTVALVVHPEWITASVEGPAAVLTDGFATRARILRTADGRPLAWRVPAPRSSRTTAVTAVDADAFRAAFLAALIGR